MNGKISKNQFGMILALLCCSMQLGLGDIILLNVSTNNVLISIILGIFLGLIPIILYLKINKIMPDRNIYEKNKTIFNKNIATVINLMILAIYFIMLMISIRSMVLFMTSKYLQDTPYIFLGLLVILTSNIISFCSIEGIARILRICFILAFIFMIVIEIFLLRYINLDNILPIIINRNNLTSIIKGSLYFASQTSILCFLMLAISKSKVNNTNNKTIILYYLLGCLFLLSSMFFVTGCFGYNMASIYRYPEYIILKKIALSSTDLHLENLLAFRWNLYILSLCVISNYGLLTGIKSYSKNRKLNKYATILITIIGVIASKYLINDVTKSIIFMRDNYVIFVALPILLLFFLILMKLKKYS